MCLAVPMKITEIRDGEARAELDGVVRRARLDLVEGAGVGDYILIHAGYAITVVEKGEALETLEFLSGRGGPLEADHEEEDR